MTVANMYNTDMGGWAGCSNRKNLRKRENSKNTGHLHRAGVRYFLLLFANVS